MKINALTMLCGMATLGCGSPVYSPNDIIKKAIQSYGGEENIQKPRKGYIKMVGDDGLVLEEWFDSSTRYKRIAKSVLHGEPVESMILHIDGRTWVREGKGEIQETDKKPTGLLEGVTGFIESLDRSHLLEVLGEKRIEEMDTIGIREKSRGARRNLYFSKKDGWLVGC